LAGTGRVSRQQDEAAMTGPPADMVIITGMSGAGKSTTAKSLEDLDWYVIENLPPGLLPTMADLAMRGNRTPTRIAAVIDLRSGRGFGTDLATSIHELGSRGIRPRVLFLEASDETLVRRFENVRRPHPLQEDGRVVDGIAAERQLLSGIREDADLVLDTSALNVHELRARMRDFFGTGTAATLRVSVVSFGYKYGVPVDADLVADCRFLPNPRWVEALAPLNGQDERVRDYVLRQPGAEEFLKAYTETLRITFDGYGRQGKQYVTLAIGCTGGKHRSVTMAEEIGLRLAEAGLGIQVVHRDLGRE
jgi:UPF0042 nucleotide-binding protein